MTWFNPSGALTISGLYKAKSTKWRTFPETRVIWVKFTAKHNKTDIFSIMRSFIKLKNICCV